MAASILTQKKSVIHNVPALHDVHTMLRILEYLGAKVRFENADLEIDPANLGRHIAPYEFVKTMRASVSLLGPLIARFHQAEFSLPGGCVIGSRPIDLHIRGLQKLGVDVKIEDGYVKADAVKGISGNYVFLGGGFGSSVLATCNVLSAAVLAKGETIIEFAACEPEVVDLANFLISMGAVITGAGSPFIRVDGVKKLAGAEYTIIPDRIETGTYLLAGAVTGGSVKTENCQPFHLGAFLEKMKETGLDLKTGRDYVELHGNGKWNPADVVTLAYPGFPTDLQAQMMAFLTLSDGVSVITEKVFPERFIHVSELNRLGANVLLDGSQAIVKGVKKLFGAKVMASDLRASAALVIAGLAGEGTTEISRIYHLNRGYENFERKLSGLGANIKKIRETE